MMKPGTRVLASAVVCAAAMLSLPGAAMADTSATLSYDGHTRASATFTSLGEVFKVTDRYADGHAAEVTYSTSYQSGWCRNTGGAGTTKTCDLSLPEDIRITWNLSADPNEGWIQKVDYT